MAICSLHDFSLSIFLIDNLLFIQFPFIMGYPTINLEVKRIIVESTKKHKKNYPLKMMRKEIRKIRREFFRLKQNLS